MLTYSVSLKTCDGSLATIVSKRICLIPIQTLQESPYNLMWGMSVFATVSATNIYGTSTDSISDSGAVILTVPSKPINLSNIPELTSEIKLV